MAKVERKELIKIIPTFFLLLFNLIIRPVFANPDDKVITISTGEWPPYISENLKFNGIAARIIRDSFALQGYAVEFGWFPWKRTYHHVRTGAWNASAIWAKTEQRRKEVLFSDPIIDSNTVLFFRKDSLIEWQSYQDLSSIIIGATDGYFNGDEFEAAEEKRLITVERTSSERNNFKKLAAKRIDAVVAELGTGIDIMREVLTLEERENIVIGQKKISSFSNQLVFSKQLDNAEQLVKESNQGLIKLNNKGKIKEYFLESGLNNYSKR